MHSCRRGDPLLGLAALLLVLAAVPAPAGAAAKLDKAAERWLKEVHLLMLPEEEALYRDLSSNEDRREFEKIFWARRDPDPATPVNELEEAVKKARKRADDLYTIPGGERGHLTGCGQVLALLGEPLEREGREVQAQFDAAQLMREGALRPETWTYESREGDPVQYSGGELRINFDDSCRFAEGGRVLEDLRRVAASYVSRPEVDYRKTDDGRLVSLEAVLETVAAPGGLRALVASDRRDFPLEVEPHLLIRTQTGESYAAGLVRIPLDGLAPASAEDPLKVVAAVVDEAGQPGTAAEVTAPPDTVGDAVLVSWGLTLAPGQHTVRVAVQAGDRGAVAPLTLEVPDFSAPGLKTSSLLLFPESSASPPPKDKDPYAALSVGALQLQPRFGNVYTPADEINVACVIYGAATDPASGKASLAARYSFLKEGRPIAKGEEQPFDTETAVASVGPIPLSGFAPGKYKVRLDVEDRHSGQKHRQEVAFVIEE